MDDVVEGIEEEVVERVVEPLGRRFFWVKATGNVVAQRWNASEGVESTKEEDFETYRELKEYNPDAIEMTTFAHGQHEESFSQAKSCRFNTDSGEIEFLYGDSNETEPVWERPITEQLNELKEWRKVTDSAIVALMDMSMM